MISLSDNPKVAPRLERSVTSSHLMNALDPKSSNMKTSVSTAGTDLTSSTLAKTGVSTLDPVMAAFLEHRAQRESKTNRHLRHFRQRYLETIIEDCVSDVTDDENKENVTSQDVCSTSVKTIRKKPRRMPKGHHSSVVKSGIDITGGKLYFGSSGGANKVLSRKKSSGQQYFPAPDGGTTINENQTSNNHDISFSHLGNDLKSIKQSVDDSRKVGVGETVVWSEDKTFLCDFSVQTSAWKTNTPPTPAPKHITASVTSAALGSFEGGHMSPQGGESVDEMKYEKVRQITQISEDLNPLLPKRNTVDDANHLGGAAWKNLSTISSASSRASLREQTSFGNTYSGVFHSTLSYPLHSTMQHTSLALSPIAPAAPVYSNRRLKQNDLTATVDSKSTNQEHSAKKKYVRRNSETSYSDNDNSARLLQSVKKVGRDPYLSLINKHSTAYSSIEKFQLIRDSTKQNCPSTRSSSLSDGREVHRTNMDQSPYTEWRMKNMGSFPVVHTSERPPPMKRSVGCRRLGLLSMQPYTTSIALGDPHLSLEATRGSFANFDSFSTNNTLSSVVSDLSNVRRRRDFSTEHSGLDSNTKSQLWRRQTHQYSFANSQSSEDQDDVTRDTLKCHGGQCLYLARRHRQCPNQVILNRENECEQSELYTHQVPSTPRHNHRPPCRPQSTLPDLIQSSQQCKLYHERCLHRVGPGALDNFEQHHHHHQHKLSGMEFEYRNGARTQVGTTARKGEKRSRGSLVGKKLSCFTRMLCTNSEVTQIFTADPFE